MAGGPAGADGSAPVVLQRLSDLVRAEGGLLADALIEPDGDAALGALAARGLRGDGHAVDLELVVEATYEGYLLHYGEPRLMTREDDDLALLAGDRLYALGLERLAAAGDLEAVRALADVIALGAQAQAAADAELARAVWEAGAVEVGWGPADALAHAKNAARAGDSGAADALRAAARQVAGHLAPVR
ncbi:MAG: hypothetical protein HZB46_04125 [Solirubrobacterales bacterium]|nr:hypothetical protein [Solirubrobacterales bacterium]